MRSVRRQGILISGLVAAVTLAWFAVRESSCTTVEAAFWIADDVYGSRRLGIDLARSEIDRVAEVARQEVKGAFGGLNIAISDRRDARYRVIVVEELRDLRFRRQDSVPALSRAVSGVGGKGAVSFSWMAEAARSHLPAGADRSQTLEAVGRAIGRAAVHEFAHILVPRAPIHDSTDTASYEFETASRREQFSGEMHWGVAWPYLQKRLSPCAPTVLVVD